MSGNIRVSSVMNVRDNTLQENYAPHDVLEGFLTRKLHTVGLHVEQYGDDNRHHDGERITYGESPDLAIYHNDALCCYIEVKSKREEYANWMGRLNKSSWEECLLGETEYSDGDCSFEGAHFLDVPVFIYFGVVDEADARVLNTSFIPVESGDQVETGFHAQGNVVVELDMEASRNFEWVIEEVTGRDPYLLESEYERRHALSL